VSQRDGFEGMIVDKIAQLLRETQERWISLVPFGAGRVSRKDRTKK
jgi:hypothetical protein